MSNNFNEYQKTFFQLSTSAEKSISDISTTATKAMYDTQSVVSPTAEAFKLLASNITPLAETIKHSQIALSLLAEKLTSQIPQIHECTFSCTEIPKIPLDAFDFIHKINFQDDCIDLTEDNCNTVNTLLNLTDSLTPSTIIPNTKTPMNQFIISILIPVIIGLLQLGQNAYYHQQDSIESLRTQVQEQEQKYRNQILTLLTDIQNSLSDLQESHQCTSSDEPFHQSEESVHTTDDQSRTDVAE